MATGPGPGRLPMPSACSPRNAAVPSGHSKLAETLVGATRWVATAVGATRSVLATAPDPASGWFRTTARQTADRALATPAAAPEIPMPAATRAVTTAAAAAPEVTTAAAARTKAATATTIQALTTTTS